MRVSISIHALLAESDKSGKSDCDKNWRFLSTLSLRRATTHPIGVFIAEIISIHALLAESDGAVLKLQCIHGNFYPRSPCGERRYLINTYHRIFGISIHALLAESDLVLVSMICLPRDFYPRSPCGERPHYDNYNLHCVEISIHALLAESDRIL